MDVWADDASWMVVMAAVVAGGNGATMLAKEDEELFWSHVTAKPVSQHTVGAVNGHFHPQQV